MKRIEIATLIFASALIFNVGCAKDDDPQPKERGSIEEGKFADFVILDENVLTCDAQSIGNVQVLKNSLRGQEVYSKQ